VPTSGPGSIWAPNGPEMGSKWAQSGIMMRSARRTATRVPFRAQSEPQICNIRDFFDPKVSNDPPRIRPASSLLHDVWVGSSRGEWVVLALAVAAVSFWSGWRHTGQDRRVRPPSSSALPPPRSRRSRGTTIRWFVAVGVYLTFCGRRRAAVASPLLLGLTAVASPIWPHGEDPVMWQQLACTVPRYRRHAPIPFRRSALYERG
jgi:hypothetical protein